MRVGLRRLRAAISLFAKLLGDRETDGGNQHLRNEGPPCAAMTDPSRRQIDRTKIRGHPTPTGKVSRKDRLK